LLLTELFPPFVGGSAVLFENVYSRLEIPEVTVLTDLAGSPRGPEQVGRLKVVRDAIATARWGLLNPSGLAHHLRVARIVREIPAGSWAVLHCGRALPEGLQAMMATWGTRRRYLCWTHGEELAYIRTSRELAFLVRIVYARAAAVIANSRHTAQMLEHFGVLPQKIHVVYPGVDAARFHPSIDGSHLRRRLADEGDVLLLSVGRLQRRKGHDLVIAAMAALRDERPRLRYAIIGAGDERPSLEALVNKERLTDRVTFLGQVEDVDLPTHYAASDVFVMPNRVDGVDIEGFGIVFLEASASGRPVIGGRSGGVPEAVEEGQTGYLVSGTDVHELVIALRSLARSPELRRTMGAAGRTRALTQFTWSRSAAAVTDLHRSLVAAR
jgi:phosphatidyl-myo-inositol dimannoside synthase